MRTAVVCTIFSFWSSRVRVFIEYWHAMLHCGNFIVVPIYLSIYLSIYPSIYLYSISTYLSICPSIYPAVYLSICRYSISTYLSTYLPIIYFLSIHPSIYLYSISTYIPTYLPIIYFLSIYLSTYLCLYLLIWLQVYPPVPILSSIHKSFSVSIYLPIYLYQNSRSQQWQFNLSVCVIFKRVRSKLYCISSLSVTSTWQNKWSEKGNYGSLKLGVIVEGLRLHCCVETRGF